MTQSFPSRIDGDTLRRWIFRAFFVGLAVGIAAGAAALLN